LKSIQIQIKSSQNFEKKKLAKNQGVTPDRLMLSLALPTNPHTLMNLVHASSGLVGAQDFKSMSVTSYTPLGWCVGFLGAFFRVLTRRVIAAALSRSRLLDP
jgi:hypothetical protein